MSSFKEGLKKSGQSVLDARAQNLYEMTKIEEFQKIELLQKDCFHLKCHNLKAELRQCFSLIFKEFNRFRKNDLFGALNVAV